MQGAAEEVSQEDELAVRALLQQLMDGWNEGSGDAFAAAFAEDASFVGSDGTRLEGRQRIASFHQMLFDKLLKGSRFVIKVRSLRFLTPELAVMHAVGATSMPEQLNRESERDSIQTLVAIKSAGVWLLLRFRMRGLRLVRLVANWN